MSLDVTALRGSFTAVAPKADALATTFYATLFERYPEVRPLFAHTDLGEQKKKLIAAISLVVASLEKPDALTGALKVLGAKHVGYGAEPGHYAAVGECLLHALAVTAGDVWTDELNTAWADAYGAITSIMLEGAGELAAAE
ncbi:MAG: flavohemoprotein [Myxococcales bacterium]|nr:flavohemoprotein [Myxococcales bacterium]